MKGLSRGFLLGAVALAAVFAFSATTAQAQANKCLSGKTKCVTKKLAGLLKCRGKCQKDPAKCLAVQDACEAKVYAKFDGGTKGIAAGCLGKLEVKNDGPCVTFGDLTALEAKVDAFVGDVLSELEPTPPSGVNKCLSGKSKCVSKKAEGLLKCIGKCQKDPAKCLAVQDACEAKVYAKFDGGTKGIAAGCLGKLEVKNDGPCKTFGDLTALEAKVDAFVADVQSELESPVPPACPTEATFVGTSGSLGVLDAGWTGFGHNSPVVSDGLVTISVTGCAGSAPNCGVCTYTGPIPNHGTNELNSRRCYCDSGVTCTSDADCPGTCTRTSTVANKCVFNFGSYLPLVAGGITSCVQNHFASALSGTFNEDTGETVGNANVHSTVFLGADLDEPCPACVGDTTPNDGIKGGTCSAGADAGTQCDVNGTHPNTIWGDTSLDCRPLPGAHIGTLPIDLSNTTGTKTLTLGSNSPSCTAPTWGTAKCFCDTCNNINADPCAVHSDCPDNPPGTPGVCGGRRCRGGANDGAPCALPSVCGTGVCERPGAATKPNACNDFDGDTQNNCNGGLCTEIGPTDFYCEPNAFHRQCTNNADCALYGDTCTRQLTRPCHSNGLLGDSVTATGAADPPSGHQSDPTLAALFCIAPTSNGSVNDAAGLPGLGRLELPGHATDNGTGP